VPEKEIVAEAGIAGTVRAITTEVMSPDVMIDTALHILAACGSHQARRIDCR
jgi:hypothetical protein